ncbi:hypothetical protein HY522_10040 [bacterium]|nr:hypothetical protein [bacterium]
MNNRTARLLTPTLADVIFVAVFLYICLLSGQRLLKDADTGHHIRAGEQMMAGRSIPKTDMFSFISPPLPWTAHSWLSEVIMALLHRVGGLTGIVIFFAAVISSVYALLFKMLRARAGPVLPALAVTLLVILCSQFHWLARPYVFSHVLLVIWYFILNTHQSGFRTSLLALPPLMLLWVNLHGAFIIGFVLLGIFLAGNWIQVMNREGDLPAVRARIRGLWVATAGCLAASLLNPAGFHILLFPFKIISDTYMMDHVSEYLAPNFHDARLLPFKYTILIVIGFLCLARARLGAVEILLVLVFANMALQSARHIPLFAVIMAPVLLRLSSAWMDDCGGRLSAWCRRKSETLGKVDGGATGGVWIAAAVLGVGLLAAGDRLEYGFDPKLKPVEAVRFLKREPIPGNMFSDDESGDYLIYAAWPEYKVFFDGRSDMYGPERLKEYLSVISMGPDWEKVIEKYGIGWIMFRAKSVLSRHLLKDSSWRLIYADSLTQIFVRDIPEYSHLVDKYKDVKPVGEVPGE